MAKRKVKRKAPKRKRKVVKRKRKAPKRRRKRKFGMTASDLIKPAKEEILIEIDKKFSDDKIAGKINKIDKLKSKATMLIENIKVIRDKLKLDIKADTINFSNLQEYIKNKGNEAVESLYTMIGDLGLRNTVLEKVKKKIPGGALAAIPALKVAEGAFKILYAKSKDTKKMMLNIFGNILFDNKELLQKKMKKLKIMNC